MFAQVQIHETLVQAARPQRAMRCAASLRPTIAKQPPSMGVSRSVTLGKHRLSHAARSVRMAATSDDGSENTGPQDEIDQKFNGSGEIDLQSAGEFMIKGETEFLDKAAENSAVRETLQALDSAREAEAEVLGQAWDLLAQMGVKRPSEGPGSEEDKEDKEDA
uniref:Uncharacterized protein n=1 Tax=Pyramimonas obovata TaxID=1411642 RepID=A0A7S0RA83_9CHLO|mmetsp:Transcript_28919/g.63307  ORF Transcript_28919/g.63307 Transcript_28919/m.63307 type:complete len:163 (+) Transcript_28919:81-569(+)|eukprot:CAMPEP_0118935124 /NCGR_PEP_ID=MMETSP1169-20130426/14954_1 /TAXON_ID=36882 /ORGANISM="Pyramimonas obovata, Strain CCMP722" /LENGTH=162 /DNA_ID=CAMNT_0006878111 /DNA_START=53 /DNA_END=541 /DNA_ORIENTATION=-